MNHFVGTAAFYAEFRPGYPEEVWDLLIATAAVDGASRVLDLGCGPGTATVPLAKRSGHVTAVDLDPEMVRHGRRLAEADDITNVEWMNIPAEQVDFPDDHFQLIVSASAFHWMDRTLVATKCQSMLNGSGVLALLGNPTPLIQVRERTGVGAAIADVQDRWFGEGDQVLNTDDLERPEVILDRTGFRDVSVTYIPQVQEWSVERLLGFLRSTSSRPDQRLGDDFPRFAADIETAIRAVEPTGRWTLDNRVEVIVGRATLR